MPDILNKIYKILLLLICAAWGQKIQAQVQTGGLDVGTGGGSGLGGKLGAFNMGNNAGNIKTDSLGRIQSDWDDTPAIIHYNNFNSNYKRSIDTAISKFHRYQYAQPYWGRNLGNDGSATTNLLFSPNTRIGLQSGFDVFDSYGIPLDSVRFYNTTRPYSDFGFLMGGKRQQHVSLLHTQNVNSKWNFAGYIQSHNNPGFYKFQQIRSIVAGINSYYISNNDRYQIKTGIHYTRYQQDENGGLLADSLIENGSYLSLSTIPVLFPYHPQSSKRSSASNLLTNTSFFLQQQYAAWGTRDTLYNEDSTKMTPVFLTRFTIRHQLITQLQRHIYKDKSPEPNVYRTFDNSPFIFAPSDSVYGRHEWNYIENKFSLGSSIGQSAKLANLEVGFATRFDFFKSHIIQSTLKDNYFSNYLFGQLQKEAFTNKEWFYNANAQFYITGPTLGDFSVRADAGRIIGDFAVLQAGLSQTLSSLPYFTTQYRTNYYERTAEGNKQNVTSIFGAIGLPKWRTKFSVKNQLLANYYYFDTTMHLNQSATAFNVLQLGANKEFKLGIFYLDNEIVYQQKGNAPINIPNWMFRHQLRIETPAIQNKVQFTLGLEAMYFSKYALNGYSPFLHQFYYQSAYQYQMKPEIRAFFNFKVRGFRAFVLAEQLQTFLWDVNFYAKNYTGTNFNFKFGFNWVLVN